MTQTTSSPTYYTRRLVYYVKELWRRREFIWFLAMGNFKARNASTALGLFWWVLNPVLLSLVYWLVFGFIFPSDRNIIYLMSGMFVFHFTAQALTGGANAVLQNSKLLTNLKFPRLILPLANLFEALIGFLVSLGVLLAVQMVLFVVIRDPESSPQIFFPTAFVVLLLVAIPLQFLFNLGLGSIAARLAVPFRDINNFIPYVNRIWLYLSPIIWPLTMLDTERGQDFAPYAELNPLFPLISVYRAALIGDPFDEKMLVQFAIWALVIGVFGIGLFVRYEGKIARHL